MMLFRICQFSARNEARWRGIIGSWHDPGHMRQNDSENIFDTRPFRIWQGQIVPESSRLKGVSDPNLR
jgi:hypothetical protein